MHRVFLSHTSTLARVPPQRSFVAAALDAVTEACQLSSDMRFFTADDHTPAEVCRQRVRECSVYIGIFGLDYGSVVREGPDLSYTELEFLTALEQHRLGSMRVFVFLLREDAGVPGLGPLELRQADFRRRVLNDHGLTAAFFANPDELRHLVYRALKEQLPAPLRPDRPLQHLRYRAVDFRGRQHELDELLGMVRSARAGGTALSFVSLRGLGGVGKSALAAELAEHLGRDTAFPGGVLWTNLLEEDPVNAARRWVRDLRGDPGALGPQECLQRFHELAATRGVLVVLDNAQVPGAGSSNPVEQLLVRAVGVATLITTRFQQAIPTGVPVREIDVLTPADARDLLRSHLGPDLEADPNAAEELIRLCERLPLFLNVAGKAVANRHYTLRSYAEELRRRGLEALIANDARAAVVFDLSWRHLSSAAQEVFTVLALAPGDDVGPNLVRAWHRQAAERGCWWWLDPRRWLGGSRATPEEDPHGPGQLLGELANASLLMPVGAQAQRYRYHDRVRDYALSKLGRPRAEVQRQLLNCWTDWDMVRAEVDAVGVFDLAGQYRQLRGWGLREPADFAPWYHFVLGQSHVLAAAPELFFQQAYNQPVNSPVSRAAQRRAHKGEAPERWLEWINRPRRFEPPACLQVLQGHVGWVQSVAVTGDGGIAVSGASDKTVRVWDLRTGRCRALLQGHTDEVQSVAVTGDGHTALSGAADETVRVWNLGTGHCQAVLQGHTGVVASVAVTGDGQTGVSGARDSTVRVWDLGTGQCQAVFQGHTGTVHSVAVTGDGRIAVSGGDDSTVRVWDLRTGRCQRVLHGHTALVASVLVTGDGQSAVSGGRDQTVRVWDLRTGHCRAVLQGHTALVQSVALTRDGRTAVSGGDDSTVRVWDLRTGRCRAVLLGHTNVVYSVAVTEDGQTAVSGAHDTTVRVWDLRTGCCQPALQGHADQAYSVAVTEDGQTAISGAWDKALRVWDLRTGRCRALLKGHAGPVHSVAVTGDGQTAVSGAHDQTVRVWDLRTRRCRAVLLGHTDAVMSVAVTRDGRIAVSGAADRTVRVWDLGTGHCRAIYLDSGEEARRAWDMTRQGRSFTLDTEGSFLILRAASSGEVMARFPVDACTWDCSADGQQIVAGDRRGQLYFLRLRTRGDKRTDP